MDSARKLALCPICDSKCVDTRGIRKPQEGKAIHKDVKLHGEQKKQHAMPLSSPKNVKKIWASEYHH